MEESQRGPTQIPPVPTPSAEPGQQAAAPAPQAPQQAPAPQVFSAAPAQAAPQIAYTGNAPAEQTYVPPADFEPAPLQRPELQPITWTASEFIAHEKNSTWYGALVLGTIIVAVVTYVLTRDFVSVGVVLFAAAGLAYLAGREPGTQQYMLDHDGLHIGEKLYPFIDFKNFSIAAEGAMPSIVLTPLKRFMPPVTVYIDPEQSDTVVSFLSAFLPLVPHKPDGVDRLMGRLRF